MGYDKKNNIYSISHKGELLIWLIIICFLIGIFTFVSNYKESHQKNDYHIFLNDVDGLIVGSPVRMMGVEVGYITKIKPMQNQMYVKFLLTNPDVYLPQGTSVTVEFSGLAGSKSLELYLPDKNTYIDETTPIVTVTPPKRLHDALGLLGDMYSKLNSIILTTSSFGKKMEEIDFSGATLETQGELLNYSNRLIKKFSNDEN